jgi:hypothetical protein
MSLRTAAGEALHRLPLPVHRVLPPDQRADLRHRFGRFRRWETGVDLTPPPPRAGEMIGAPDFVGVGSPACGSRWWFRLVAEHLGVSTRGDLPMARRYLSHFATAGFGHAEVLGYHGWFPRPPDTVTGEWTPSYLSQPWVPPLLAQAAPAARILAMVRDPIARMQVDLAHSIDQRASNVGVYSADALDAGFYAQQLRHLLHFFPAGQVLVLQYERCLADPAGQLAATYRFLGLDDEHLPVNVTPTGAELGPPPPPVDRDTEHRLADIYAADVAELSTLVSDFDPWLWPAWAGR